MVFALAGDSTTTSFMGFLVPYAYAYEDGKRRLSASRPVPRRARLALGPQLDYEEGPGGENMSKEAEERRDRLAVDLDKAIHVLGSAGRRNYLATFSLALIGSGASVMAGILAFLQVDSVIVGVLALIPAMCAIVVGRLKLQDRANWYYRKRTALFALYNEVHFELPDPPTSAAIAEISRKWSALNQQMEGDWGSRLALTLEDMNRTAASAARTP
ncbi:MAG: hypothetical protein E6G92_03435 [Alphaproteobacteria bacterium]|nr:MAG: hypothetical protein E6G92_03435 [Alphaproteobacteria bacterium]